MRTRPHAQVQPASRLQNYGLTAKNAELAKNTGAPGFYGERPRNASGILHLTQQDVSRDAQTTDQGTDHFEAEASAP